MTAPTIRPIKLAHVILHTHDVRRLSDWYVKALGAWPTVDQPPNLIFLTFDDEHHRIGFIQTAPDRPDPVSGAKGLAHLAFTMGSAVELLAKYEQLKADGYSPATTIHHGPTVSAYYRDPDGNVVEFFTEVFATLEEACAFQQTPLFRENPVGKPVDFDVLAERARQGASHEELVAYPDVKIAPWELAGQMYAAMYPVD